MATSKIQESKNLTLRELINLAMANPKDKNLSICQTIQDKIFHSAENLKITYITYQCEEFCINGYYSYINNFGENAVDSFCTQMWIGGGQIRFHSVVWQNRIDLRYDIMYDIDQCFQKISDQIEKKACIE